MMTDKRSRFSSVLQRTCVALFLILLALLSVQNIAAQPGDRRTPQEIRKALEDQLAAVEKQMAEDPDNHYLYESRGKALTELFRRSEDPLERNSFAERAFADFDTYELLTKTPPDLSRAELHQLIWWTEAPDPRRSDVTVASVEAFRNSPHFEAAVSAYVEEIRKLDQAKGQARYDEYLRQLCATVSNLYLSRAQVVTGIPGAVGAINEPQRVWDDFDQAAKYRKKSVYAAILLFVTDVYVSKGEAAFALGEYEIALDAYQAADDYMDRNWERYCEYHGAENCEGRKKEYAARITLMRAQAYLKQGDYEKAISYLDNYVTNAPAYLLRCPQPYQLRAQANRKLGRIELARADEKQARQVNGTSCN